MSIIHKALQKAEKEGQIQESNSVNEKEGFFTGKEGFVKKKKSVLKIIIPLAAFLLISSILVYFLKFKRHIEVVDTKEKNSPTITIIKKETERVEEKSDYFAEAAKHYKNQDYENSVKFYNRALETIINDPTLYNNLGLAYLKLKDYEKALENFEKAINIAPNCLPCLNSIGMAKTIVGDYELAEVYLKKAIRIKKTYTDPYFNLGVLYEKKGHLSKAVNYYTQFLMLIPKQSKIANVVKKRISKLTNG